MTEKTRICETCAWWENTDVMKDVEGYESNIMTGACHYEPTEITKWSSDWCRHWSETTGWDRFEQMPTELEQEAFEIFQQNYPDPRLATLDIQQWLEEYRRKC